jgi:SAM-dependent MidA family methyltransferase
MTLKDRLKAEIPLTGPLTVAQYMTRCLHDPQDGYYATRPRLGAQGDFITAPMVSQMFGELIGLWCAEAWSRLGRPGRLVWAEVGPGDGTLITDALRAASQAAPEFLKAAELWLVEPSPVLQEVQQARLEGASVRANWSRKLDELPDDAPLVLIANEVLDCLPVRQLIRTSRGWAERMVGLDDRGELAFGLNSAPLERLAPEAEPGAVLELPAAQEAFGAEVAVLIARQGGVALLVDYGRAEPGFGDTLQALKSHKKVPPLETPGEADLTVHADFPAVLAAARAAGAETSGILSQREFLQQLGIEARAAALLRAQPDRAATIARQLERLIGPGEMGDLFKAAAIHSPALDPPGFEHG